MEKFIFVKGKKDQSLKMITARIESGLSIREWCEINGISTGTYDYHAGKLRKAGLYPGMESMPGYRQKVPGSRLSESSCFPTPVPAFAEIPVSPPNSSSGANSSAWNPEIIVECGAFKISISQNTSKDMIRSVLEVAAGVH